MPTYKVKAKNKKQESMLVEWLKKVGIKFTKPRKKGGSGKKGKAFEKEIAIDLSRWFAGRDDIFYCTSGSGSRFTARKKQGKETANSCGDIGLLDPIGQPFLDVFSVEVKRGYTDDLDILSIVDSDNKNHTLLDWVEKANKEVEEAGRRWFIIIIRRDNKNRVVVVPSGICEILSMWPDKEITVYIKGMFEGIVIMDFDTFFQYLKPEKLEKLK